MIIPKTLKMGYPNMKYNFLRFPGGKEKAVTLSYDDGSKYDLKFLEIINQYGFKCTFNLMGKNVESEKPLSQAAIRENMLAKGHEIAVHGYNHRAQHKIRPIEGIREIVDCRIALERAFGIIVRGMAFPAEVVNPSLEPEKYARIKHYLEDLEVAYARSARPDNDRFELPEDWYNWIPTAHHDNPQIMQYIDKFVNLDLSELYITKRTPKLFFMWGHCKEFERKQNWDHLEEICRSLGGRDDIWYATNIEIYDYVQAYRSLRYSADAGIVFNPTLLDVWFDVDGVLYCVKSGETITINA